MSTWRPLPERRREAADPRPVGDSLDGVTRRLGAPVAAVLGAVFRHWEDIVGPTVAANVRPVSLRAGVLVVATEHPAWAAQLRFLGPDLARRVAAVTGDGTVTRVDVRVVPAARDDRSSDRI